MAALQNSPKRERHQDEDLWTLLRTQGQRITELERKNLELTEALAKQAALEKQRWQWFLQGNQELLRQELQLVAETSASAATATATQEESEEESNNSGGSNKKHSAWFLPSLPVTGGGSLRLSKKKLATRAKSARNKSPFMFDNSNASSDEPKKEKEDSKKDDTKKQKKKKAAAKAPDSPIPCTKAEEGGESKSRGGSKRSKLTKKQLTPSSSSASSPTPVKRDMSMTSLLDALDLICDQPDEERARRRSFKGHMNRPVAPSYSFTPFVPSTPPTSYASFGGHRGEAKEKEKERIEKNQIDKAEERGEVDKEESEQKAEREEKVSSPVTERRQGVAFVPYKELSFIKKIGEGEYGVVFYGKWDDEEVAIKQLHSIDESQQMMLMKEAHLMGSLSTHLNVIRIIGVSLERNNPSCILTEFMPGGSLLTYLHQLSEAPSQTQQVRMALDVARGMRHLHANRITHRDLATRNLLLDNDLTIKVSDFGMSRRLNSDTEVTKSNTGPLKWMPPESLINRQYSEKSDVWAFAVTMWEVANKGAVPYAELSNIATAIAVMNATTTLDFSCIQPKLYQNLLNRCMQRNASDRPTFNEIVQALEYLLKSMS